MTRYIVSAAALVLTLATSPATAQEFRGDCKSIQTADACKSSGWCRWTTLKLPDGTRFAPPNACKWKPGFKTAWEATKKQ